ncbi:hypothetical protein N7326_07995 [Corynebacterium sp. ES2794-CONJ1]|nr:hypothetical protein [Corynebacterium sp. ES2794-CONJ1]
MSLILNTSQIRITQDFYYPLKELESRCLITPVADRGANTSGVLHMMGSGCDTMHVLVVAKFSLRIRRRLID